MQTLNRDNFVTLKDAVAALELSDPTVIINGKRYQPFYHPIKGTRRLRVFDLAGFRKHEETQYALIEKAKLFVEWLIHERGFTNTEIAEKAGISHQLVNSHRWSFEVAYKIVASNRDYVYSFDKYYGWK